MKLSSIDPNSMKDMVVHFPQMLNSLKVESDILETCREFKEQDFRGICFLGMGGSSIAGNYIRALVSDISNKPLSVVRDYTIPKYITKKWIVIAASYSGNTEETLASLDSAIKADAKIILVTSGGDMSKNSDRPIINLPTKIQPRAALPLMLSALLPITEILLDFDLTDFSKISDYLIEVSKHWKDNISEPRYVAEMLENKIPIFIGARHLAPVAYRAKCQINENSKAPAFYSELPEANHNEIEGMVDTLDRPFLPVFLRSGIDDSRINKRFDVTKSLYDEMGLNTLNLLSEGDTRLAEMLTLTHHLDMVSVELANLRGADPVSVDRISELKRRLG